MIDEDQEISEILSRQYQKVFSKAMVNHDVPLLDAVNTCLTDFEFTKLSIELAIDELGGNSAPGPDNVPAKVLKMCKMSISYPLYRMWRKSLDDGIIPTAYKHAIISPIPKSGNSTDPDNYRPVSQLLVT